MVVEVVHGSQCYALSDNKLSHMMNIMVTVTSCLCEVIPLHDEVGLCNVINCR